MWFFLTNSTNDLDNIVKSYYNYVIVIRKIIIMQKIIRKCLDNEIISYLFFGGVATIISIGSFWLCNLILHQAMLSNLISWILAVAFQFWTNKNWVFKATKTKSALESFTQFTLSRITTLIIETIIIGIFADYLHFKALLVKIVGEIIVIIGNYILSKFWVFK